MNGMLRIKESCKMLFLLQRPYCSLHTYHSLVGLLDSSSLLLSSTVTSTMFTLSLVSSTSTVAFFSIFTSYLGHVSTRFASFLALLSRRRRTNRMMRRNRATIEPINRATLRPMFLLACTLFTSKLTPLFSITSSDFGRSSMSMLWLEDAPL